MTKTGFMTAYSTINKIEDLLNEARELFDKIQPSAQQAILNHHNDPATLQHCLRWGLQAATEIREDWHAVVSGLSCGEGAG